MTSLLRRASQYVERNSASLMFRSLVDVRLDRPLISFTFDDFPRSALLCGGEILRQCGVAGTYYTALGLAGTDIPSGNAFVPQDLASALEDGHELGCHTFDHYHAWQTSAAEFEHSVERNADALARILPGAKFRSHSYPISSPRPQTKRRVARHFLTCRGGGQTWNQGRADMNQLSAFFLEKVHGQLEPVTQLIRQCQAARGWLIFATHDVDPNPSPYGVTPEFFEAVVDQAIASGASVLPVSAALDVVRSSAAGAGQRNNSHPG